MENRIMASLDSLLTLSSGLKGADLATIGINGSSLGITPASLGVTNAEDRLFKEVTDGSRRPHMIPTISSMTYRNGGWSYGWSSGEAWTSYYAYHNSEPDAERSFWMALGTNSRNNTLSYSDVGENRVIEYATNSTVGGFEMISILDNRSNYNPIRFRLMFIRNHHPTLTKTVTVWGHYTSYWSSGHEGSAFAWGIPNVNGSYNNVTRINWTTPGQRTGGNSNYTWSHARAIPPKTTIVAMQVSSGYYWRSNQHMMNNKFYELNSTFSDFWIQPDLKMTQAASVYNDQLSEFNVYNAYRVWNKTAELFGDR